MWSGGQNGTHLIGIEDDVITLAGLNPEGVCHVWNDRGEVGTDHGEIVVVKLNGKGALGSTVRC